MADDSLNTLAAVADAVEMQCCVEIRPVGHMLGVVRPLCLAAREAAGGSPMLRATELLLRHVNAGDTVVVATGFHVPGSMPQGETDGPPGAAALASAVSLGLGAFPIVLADPDTVEPVRAACRTIGLVERSTVTPGLASSFVLDTMPVDDQAEGFADLLLSKHAVKAVVVIEKPGLNAVGVAHTAGGKRIMSGRSRIEVLMDLARQRGVPVIAIGDNGNEAGMGAIAAATRRYKRFGDRCLCECGGGIAAVESADATVVGSISNWAAYGISATLAVALRNASLLHDGETEKRVIAECLRAGAVDGLSGSHRFSVDGIPAQISAHVVDILRTIVTTVLNGA